MAALDIPCVFVVHAGDLEPRAVLLAASLRAACGDSATLIAAAPEAHSGFDPPSEATREFLSGLGVRWAGFRQPFGARYSIANKIDALAAAGEGPALLLDSDILCLQAPPLGDLAPADAAAKPSDVLLYRPGNQAWREMYSRFDLPDCERRVVTTLSGELTYPYFNAGVVFTRNAALLAGRWLAYCERVAGDDTIPSKFPWLDQIALPLAIQSLGWNFACLSERWNYPVHLRRLSDSAAGPHLAHYHQLEFLNREPALAKLVRQLTRRFPGLAAVLEAHGWTISNFREPCGGPDFFLTGIPRSGTSLLTRLLDDQPNHVVLNEPRVPPALLHGSARGLATWYAGLRQAIRERRPVENKAVDGRVVTDTAAVNQRIRYVPEIQSGAFSFGTKNTFEYLCRLAILRQAMPEAPIFVCVRDPVSTIDSWKRTFSHLASSDAEDLVARGLLDECGPVWERRRIAEIRAEGDERLRRALLWRHLALLIAENADRLTLVRYESLTVSPGAELARVLRGIHGEAGPGDPLLGAEIRLPGPPSGIDPAERQIIQDVCSAAAETIGCISR